MPKKRCCTKKYQSAIVLEPDSVIVDSFVYGGGSESSFTQALVAAMETDLLTVVYQPKFELTEHRVAGAEALLRWCPDGVHPVSPASFIPIAENSGLITLVDTWVVTRVCNQISQWKRSGYEHGRIAVNVSAGTFCSIDLVASIRRILKATNVLPSDLEIEMTETAALTDLSMAVRNISNLRDCGVQVALDDFGAGHSNLSLLMDCKIDVVKLDRSVVGRALSNERTMSFVREVVKLLHKLDIEIVAEGVESVQQLEAVSAAGCDVVQGYCLSRPISAADLAERYFYRKNTNDEYYLRSPTQC